MTLPKFWFLQYSIIARIFQVLISCNINIITNLIDSNFSKSEFVSDVGRAIITLELYGSVGLVLHLFRFGLILDNE